MKKRSAFGNHLKAIRKSVRWSQSDLARHTDLSVEAISNLERGMNHPSFQTLERLSRAFNIPMRDFFEFDEAGRANSELLAELMTAARQLDHSDLEAAIEIVHTLADRNRGRT